MEKSFMNSEILEEEKRIISEKWVANIVSAYGCTKYNSIISPSGDDIRDRLWDLASVTKIYSLFVILSLHEKGLFDITKKIKDYTNNYIDLSELYVYELLNFSVELSTGSRIDACKSYAEAVNLLHSAQIKSKTTKYSDIGIMVVVQLINDLYHSDLYFRNYTYEILRKIGALNTCWWKDIDSNNTNIENYDSEYRCIDDKIIEINTPLGMCHDSKARIIPYTGHAGLFSSAKDVSVFANALLNGAIISKRTIELVLSNVFDSWDTTHHYGLLCNKKHPDIKYSEIPISCSENCIAISGYTGTYLLLDFDNSSYIFIGANRIHNRITNLSYDKSTDIYPCTKDYVFRKDTLRDMIALELLRS